MFRSISKILIFSLFCAICHSFPGANDEKSSVYAEMDMIELKIAEDLDMQEILNDVWYVIKAYPASTEASPAECMKATFKYENELDTKITAQQIYQNSKTILNLSVTSRVQGMLILNTTHSIEKQSPPWVLRYRVNIY
jgi:hypothetical protein